MPSDQFRLFAKYFTTIISFGGSIIFGHVAAFIHRFTYKSLPSTQNVVVIGGSFAGALLARQLADSLPSGYKVILIEKNSHFNYVFNFPRYSVIPDREQKAFIPYDGLMKNVPHGIFEQVQDIATEVTQHAVQLRSGKSIPYAYLAIATGVSQNLPAKVISTEKHEACAELKVLQNRIQDANKIAIVGAGPVGVQLAGDIKTFYPKKSVLLIHSRQQLLSNFGERLHEYVLPKLHDLGIETKLGERPSLPGAKLLEATEMDFENGEKELFDLIIPCTGQTPNSSILENFCPTAICPSTGRILVGPTLQVQSNDKNASDIEHMFALGDVAESGGPKMGRAGFVQAGIVQKNILALIKGKSMAQYRPHSIEGILKLSLGKEEAVIYVKHEDGDELLIPNKNDKIDLSIKDAWRMFGSNLEKEHV